MKNINISIALLLFISFSICQGQGILFTYNNKGHLLQKSQQGNLPPAQISGNTQACVGETVQLTASGGTQYLWDNGATSSSIQVEATETTAYSVAVTGSNGCTKTVSHTLNIQEAPLITQITGEAFPDVVSGNLYSYSVPHHAGSFYDWVVNGGNIQSGYGTANIQVNWFTQDEGTISVTETTSANCQGEPFVMIVMAGRKQEIVVEEGWNLISTYLEVNNPAIPSILESIDANLLRVKDEFGTYYHNQNPIFNTLEQFEDGQGYWVRVMDDDMVTITGFPLDPSLVNIHLEAAPSWNLIGFPSEYPQNVETALDAIMPYVLKVKNIDESYDPSFPPVFNTLEHFVPGQGYWIKVSTTLDFSFPKVNGFNGIISANRNNVQLPEGWQRVAYPNSMIAYGWVTLDDAPVAPQDVIAVFAADECRALGTVKNTSDSSFVSMVINGEAVEDLTFKLFKNGQIYTSDFHTSLQPGQTPANLLPLRFYSPLSSLSSTLEKSLALNIYPNPTLGQFHVNFNLQKAMLVDIQLLNTAGKKVADLYKAELQAGVQNLVFDEEDIAAGTYTLKLKTHEGTVFQQVVFVGK